MTLKSLALAAILLGSTALSAQAAVVGSQGFADIGTPLADGTRTGDINTATALTIGELFSTSSNTGFLLGLPHQDFGSVTFNTTSPGSLSFGNSVFGTFTSTRFTDILSQPGAVTLYVLGNWTPGSYGGVAPGSYAASFTIAFTQTQAHNGAISDSATFSVPPSGNIPELSTWAMMGLGFSGLGLACYRNRRGAISIA